MYLLWTGPKANRRYWRNWVDGFGPKPQAEVLGSLVEAEVLAGRIMDSRGINVEVEMVDE